MTHRQTNQLVELAQAGDSDAFGVLVRRYQDMAVALAYGWCGNSEVAREVAQEAFLDAHRSLGQLRNTEAWSGWFRSIVIKHCDRVTRRRKLDTAPFESEHPGEDRSPEATYEVAQQAAQLRWSVAALPAEERLVVALTYFGGHSGAELAAFLGLPLTTVKKRLRTARARLRDHGEDLMQETLSDLKPSNTDKFARDVQFYIALRAGDRAAVSELIHEDASLLETTQNWDSDLVRRGVLPFANRATPLITAIELDSLSMVELLLDAGADVNGRCECATGEAPLWAATLFNRIAHTRLLLERGADPNPVSAAGNRPLHLAAMRGYTEIARLLLAAGADPDALDQGSAQELPWSSAAQENEKANQPRTALEWATSMGHTATAEVIRERSASAEPAPTAELFPIERRGETVLTGIKALDLFAPITRGGLIRFPFMAGVGMLVLLGELGRRFTDAGGNAVWTGFAQPPFDLKDFEGDIAEFGLSNVIERRLASFEATPEARRQAHAAGVELAEAHRDAGRDVLLVLLSAPGFENEIDATLMRLRELHQHGSITTILVTTFSGQAESWEQLPRHFTGQIKLDRARAKAHLFPAIDPVLSVSRLLEEEEAPSSRHRPLVEAARQVISAYEEADPTFTQLKADPVETRAKTLLRYLSQPFSIATPFTGTPGEHVQYDRLLDSVDSIVAT